MHGLHNVRNALSVIAIAQELKISDDVMKKAFAGFSGVKRRFTKTGEVGGITIIDDYGHWEGCRKAVDEYFEKEKVRMLLHRIDYTGRIGVKSEE